MSFGSCKYAKKWVLIPCRTRTQTSVSSAGSNFLPALPELHDEFPSQPWAEFPVRESTNGTHTCWHRSAKYWSGKERRRMMQADTKGKEAVYSATPEKPGTPGLKQLLEHAWIPTSAIRRWRRPW